MAENTSSEHDFKIGISDGVSLVDFNAPWCRPCCMQEPIVRALEEEYKGMVTVTMLNIDKHQEIALKLGIQSIPTIIIFKDGIEKKRFVGLQSGIKLSDALQPLLNLQET
jgi:thioredoxin 1